ncbi:MAG TPA: hypothetical protein VH372_04650 [Actinospica sp.]|nr:hypothetical protein [Actinospica sp.]
MRHVTAEIASQPECWAKAVQLAPATTALPAPGERVAVVGCGTSWFIAASYAAAREAAGLGETDAFASEFPAARGKFTFLGTGWTIGLAAEAGLKMREAACAWTESYPAMEYRHGPIGITGPNRVAWAFGPLPAGLDAQIAATGDHLEAAALDPMADLIRVQRLAVAIAEARGLDPDRPRHLTRSVILP